MTTGSTDSDTRTLRAVRRVLLMLLLAAFAGTFTELLLLEHDEDASQLIPLVLLATAGLCLAWTAIRPRKRVLVVFRILMVLLILSGGLGLVLHFQANLEFQRDLTPGSSTAALFWKVLAAKAPPALAPAVLAQLGCLGLIYAYRFDTRSDSETEGERHVAIR